jgi:hypothetical protein
MLTATALSTTARAIPSKSAIGIEIVLLRDRPLAALRDLRIGEVAVPALELLVEVVLIALGALLESKTTARRKAVRGVVTLSAALGEAGAIAASTVGRTGGEVCVEASALTLLTEAVRRS